MENTLMLQINFNDQNLMYINIGVHRRSGSNKKIVQGGIFPKINSCTFDVH